MRKRRSAKPLRPSRKRRGRWLVVFLVLVSKDKTRKSTSSSATCDDVSVLVDRSHSLSPDYVPKDLVPLQDYGVPTLGSDVLRLRREAAENLRHLVEGATADGEELVVASAYRSYEG